MLDKTNMFSNDGGLYHRITEPLIESNRGSCMYAHVSTNAMYRQCYSSHVRVVLVSVCWVHMYVCSDSFIWICAWLELTNAWSPGPFRSYT